MIKVMGMVPEEIYNVRWDVYGAQAAVERFVGNGAEDRVWCFLDYGFYDVQIGRKENKFNCTFNHFQIVKFTFKFLLQITH